MKLSEEEHRILSQRREFSVIANILRAWHLIKGTKSAFWLTFLAIGVALFLMVILLITIIPFTHHLFPASLAAQKIHFLNIELTLPNFINLIALFFIYITFALFIYPPLITGLNMIAIRHARGEEIHITYGFSYFSYWFQLAQVFLFIYVLGIICGIIGRWLINPLVQISLMHFFHNASPLLTTILMDLLNNVLVLFAGVFFMFAGPLVVDRHLNPWHALWYSARVASHHWLKLFFIFVIYYIINITLILLSIIPRLFVIGPLIAFIGVIWAVPFLFYNFGEAYRRLFDPVLPIQESDGSRIEIN